MKVFVLYDSLNVDESSMNMPEFITEFRDSAFYKESVQ